MRAIRARHAYDGESFLSAGATVLVEDGLVIGVEPHRLPGEEVTAGEAAVPEDDAGAPRALRGGRGTGQEIAAFTSSVTFFSTTGLHALSAYATGHMSPSSRFAAS